ncbi:MAG: hypothetical protein P8H21_03690, partial [Woeseiaceae bacterium]|nr:hypothetical protein [Woeseiaceae bacterium]
FVDTTMKTAMARNSARTTRNLHDKVVKRNWKSVQKNKNAYKVSLESNKVNDSPYKVLELD